VAMAYAKDPALADSQFYVTLAPTPQLDGKYTVFGKVISGMDVVSKIAVGDRLVRANVKGEK
jgi:peptidyl-prolyl cis-trans isomerase B (cyclophilin B)